MGLDHHHYNALPEIPSNLSDCLELYAGSLETPLFEDRLLLPSALILASSWTALAEVLDQLSDRALDTIQDQVTLQSLGVRSNVTKSITDRLDVTRNLGLKTRFAPLDQRTGEPYFEALKTLAQSLRVGAKNLLLNPSREAILQPLNAWRQQIKASELSKDESVFDLSFQTPTEDFVATIDERDNRDKNTLRSSTLKTLQETLPASSVALLRSLESGPLVNQAETLAQAIEDRQG